MNKVILIGNLGRDPEISYALSNGTAITKFSIATSEKWKDKITGEIQKRTEWHRIADYLFRFQQPTLSWPLPKEMDDVHLERPPFPQISGLSNAERPLPDLILTSTVQ